MSDSVRITGDLTIHGPAVRVTATLTVTSSGGEQQLLAADLAYDPVTGQLVYSPATGHLALDCTGGYAAYKLTPCIEAGTGCEFCPDTPPKYFAVQFVGVQGCCVSVTKYRDLSGWVLLTQVGDDACRWRGAVEIVSDTYEGAGCTGAVVSTGSTPVDVELTRVSATSWTLWVPITGGFIGSLTVASDSACMLAASMSIPNSRTACGFDGTVDVTFINGAGEVYAGDRITAGVRCPGGAVIYTDTDLAASVGKSVLLDDGVCYSVAVNMDEEVSMGGVTVVESYDTCALCCADT